MESNRSDPQLTLQPFDPEVFRRVWSRVMPDQSRSPIALSAPAPLPSCPPSPPGDRAARDPVPLCLGEDSQPYIQTLQTMMDQTRELCSALLALSRRAPARTARTLSELAAGLRREGRQLSAACFLISGARYRSAQPGEALPAPLDQALRALFHRFCRRALQAGQAALETSDPCLERLFQDLEDSAQLSARRLRALLEDM